MTIGEKIKNVRKRKKITQSALASGKITRNMISRIENGNANPSLDTLIHIAQRLGVPVSYLVSLDDDLLFYEKNEKMKIIYNAFAAREYSFCVKKIEEFSAVDEELTYILANSYFELGKHSLLRGSLKTANRYFENARKACERSVFDTRHITSVMQMYTALVANIQSPLLEFDEKKYLEGLYGVFEYEMYKYLTQDYTYDFTDLSIKNHISARALMRERRYSEALYALLDAANYILSHRYNSFLIFAIYSDIEQCYKELRDFENAYKYANKRLSMLEGFKV
ncbi:MAG: helix-turn-helix transcriptional regulator [Clostridia bacterium]|nr:helix-turn-helix transcriptional regulator [Clostridia bacterium]